MAATTSSSSSCSGFFSLRSSSNPPVEPSNRVRTSSAGGGCGKLDGVAMWFINGVTMAFFASLNRCSCIRIATEEDDGEDANDLPLMFNDGNLRHDGAVNVNATATDSRRRTGKGNKKSTTTTGAVLVDQDY